MMVVKSHGDNDADLRGIVKILHAIETIYSPAKTFSDVLPLREEHIEKAYARASALLKDKQYEQSGNLFLFLTSLDPADGRFWTGLGRSAQLMGLREQAMEAFCLSALADPESPFPHIYASEVFVEENKVDEGLQSLIWAVEAAQAQGSDKEVMMSIVTLRKKLETVQKAT